MEATFNVDLGTIGALLGSAAYFTHLIVNGLTLSWPTRPSGVAWFLAIALGIALTFLLAAATMPPDTTWTRQTYAQVVLVGLAAGGGAAGASVTQASAEAKRKQATEHTQAEPDPTTPEARAQRTATT